MPTKAETNRRRTEKARRAAMARAAGAPLIETVAKPRPARSSSTSYSRTEPRDDGLDWLEGKQRITHDQAQAGRRYGMLYRTAGIEGAGALKSCLAELGAVHAGGGGGLPTGSLVDAEWIADCRAQLAAARGALQDDDDVIAVLDLICGRGWKPRQISEAQRESEQIETALRVALDLLRRHFGRVALRNLSA